MVEHLPRGCKCCRAKASNELLHGILMKLTDYEVDSKREMCKVNPETALILHLRSGSTL